MLFAPLAAKAAIGVGRAIVGDIAKSVGNGLKEEAAKAGSTSATNRLAATVSATAKTPAEIKARKASNEFETMFLEQTLERLTASEGTDGPLGDNGTGGAVYRSMLTKEYAGQMAKSGGIGIADQVYREMIKMQEAGNASRN
ncbi:rod-binding protein [Methylobacterium sp. 10]|uniref:rod-binding protein n=1 Tax=Methylobacterium sp. 10 TaxID=1101191 RepID=UPI00047FBA45|nr:rod-binding protein [Methylobacterium sp. 10]